MDQIDVHTPPPLSLELEFWACVTEAPSYEVSTWGRVRRGDQLIDSWPNKKGYRLVALEIDRRVCLRYVHRLVLMAFVGAGAGRLANHGDGRKDNNRLHNLSWTTPAWQYATRLGDGADASDTCPAIDLSPWSRPRARSPCGRGACAPVVLRALSPRRGHRRWAALAGLVALPDLLA